MERDIVGILCRPLPLTEDEWLTLVKYRQLQISQFLGSSTLTKLSDVYCLNDGSGNINIGNRRVADIETLNTAVTEVLGLNTQGIYRATNRKKEFLRFDPEAWVSLSGLTRSNFWVGVKIVYFRDINSPLGGVCPVKVVIEKMEDIKDLKTKGFIESYFDLWSLLGEPVEKWLKSRRDQMQRLEQVAARIHLQDMVLFAKNKGRPE